MATVVNANVLLGQPIDDHVFAQVYYPLALLGHMQRNRRGRGEGKRIASPHARYDDWCGQKSQE